MTSQAENELLTRIGPGTPMGGLLRRYWQPVGTEVELAKEPVQHVRCFGEDLTLFRTERGAYGLVGERCSHRCISLEYGIPEPHGLRCPYHGWVFDTRGHCVEQPFEDLAHPGSRFKNETGIKAYPVEVLGGLVWAYLGPEPRPLLPRWDVLVREDLDRAIDIYDLPCNWLQCMDNSADPVHFEWLHAYYGNYVQRKRGGQPLMTPAKHLRIVFDRFKYGFYKRRLVEGEDETSDDWTVGHPVLFPNTLAQGGPHAPNLQIRVPIDDTHTAQIMIRTSQRKPDAPKRPIAVKRTPIFDEKGKLRGDTIPHQDLLAWVAQGPITDRTQEHLATSDRGIVFYHKLLLEQLDQMKKGLDPIGIIRDPTENQPMIELRREGKPLRAYASRYPNAFDTIQEHAAAGAGD